MIYADLTESESVRFDMLRAELQSIIDAPYLSESMWERHEEITAMMDEIITNSPRRGEWDA